MDWWLIVGIIDIESYESVFGTGAEPKSGDILSLVEYGSTRPNGRGAQQFKITNREDQKSDQINQLGGHYVWYIEATRHHHTFQPGLPTENLSEPPVQDGDFAGRLPDGANPESPPKSYTETVNDISVQIFDSNDREKRDDVYGDF